MISKKILVPERVRKISGSFAFIEHRFLRDGYWAALTHNEILLYLFLVLVSDREGLSYYGYNKICTLLKLGLDDYIHARDGLIAKDLIAFDGRLFQVLSLPTNACAKTNTLIKGGAAMQTVYPEKIRRLIDQVGVHV